MEINRGRWLLCHVHEISGLARQPDLSGREVVHEVEAVVRVQVDRWEREEDGRKKGRYVWSL